LQNFITILWKVWQEVAKVLWGITIQWRMK
jgi:hypothetical protein